jgi:arylsulfatase A-like enzyme
MFKTAARLPLSFVMACLAIVLSPVGYAAKTAATTPSHANVLFIAVDDLNDWITCLGGHPDTRSPHIDALAARGVLFERAYCAAPACNPSRAALLTGIPPYHSGVYLNPQPWRKAMPDAVTLPQHFMAHGYAVYGCGKIFHGRYKDPGSWHEYFDRPGDPQPPKRPVNGIPNTAHFDWGPVDAADEAMGDHQVVDWAIKKLKQKHDQPMFLACGPFRPHLPWYVPQKYFDLYPVDKITLPTIRDDDLDDVPPMGVKMARPDGDHRKVIESHNYRKAVQGYLASITFADAEVGRLIEALGKSPYADNTIIVLWGDHGWHLGEKLHWRKFSLWEEADRAPLLMVVPGVTKPDGRCPRPVSFMDIYPTLADLCGLPIGEHLSGQSLRPLLENPQASWDRPAITTHGRNNHAVRSERYRYIRYSDGTEELYDHENDPMEWTNLAGNAETAAVKKKLGKWLPNENAPNAEYDRGTRGKGKQQKAVKKSSRGQ